MKSSRAGFTLIELLVVIGIISLLAIVLLPDIVGARLSTNIDADQAQMRRHYQWMLQYNNTYKHLPLEGGHKFILDMWVKNAIEHTPQNLQFFFTPGLRDTNAHFQELMKSEDMEKVWPDLRSVNAEDTDYACRAKEFLKGNILSGKEALMANDNDSGWAFADGTVNVLYGDGVPQRLTYKEHLMERFGLPPQPDKEHPFQTYGKSSPHPDLQKLDN